MIPKKNIYLWHSKTSKHLQINKLGYNIELYVFGGVKIQQYKEDNQFVAFKLTENL